MSDSQTEEAEKDQRRRQGNRRNFVKLILTLGGLATIGAVASTMRILAYVPPPSGPGQAPSWPDVRVANISTLDPSTPVRFNYPLVETPCVLVKCGQAAEGGVGPDSDIVAFSDVCQHLGCFYYVLTPGKSPPCDSSFQATAPMGYCCCHGGQYDYLHGAKVIGGPPPRPVPQVTLRFDNSTGDIHAIGMGPPTIFQHGPPGTTDPTQVLNDDLTGGTIVTQATVLSGT